MYKRQYQGLQYVASQAKPLAQELVHIPGVRRVELNLALEHILFFYNPDQYTPEEMRAKADAVLLRYTMTAYNSRQEEQKQSSGVENQNSGATLRKRLFIAGTTLLLSNTLFKQGGAQLALYPTPLGSKFTTLPAMASLLLSIPLVRSAALGFRETRRPNADFLTVASIIASLLLGKGNSALTILMLSDVAEFMTTYTIERTRQSIQNLLSVNNDTVWKLLDSGAVSYTHLSSFPIRCKHAKICSVNTFLLKTPVNGSNSASFSLVISSKIPITRVGCCP